MSIDYSYQLSDSSEAASMKPNASSEPKRVLVVSYDFPPNRTSAVYRMTGLTGYLPKFGWKPTVLTIRAGEGAQEPNLIDKLPADVDIVRTRFLRINGWENSTAKTIQNVGGLRSVADARQPRLDRCVRSLGELLRSTLYFPDEYVGWVPFGLSKAIQLHREQPFDAVYTTSPPRAAPLIGLLLKSIYGIPWVSEFMDPWYPPKRRIRKKAEERLHALLLDKADRTVVMVRQHAQELGRLFNVPLEKMAVIRNGFFEDDFAFLECPAKPTFDPAFLHLAHFGSIYSDNDGNFFSALSELVRESPGLKTWLRVHIIGFPSGKVLRHAEEAELKEIIQLHGFVPDRTSTLEMMRAADCLLLFWGRPDFSRLAVAGKTYDYLRVGRPILALTEEGGVKELIEEAEAGWVVPPGNSQVIKETLKKIFDIHRNSELSRPSRPEFVAQFSWDRLAENLAEVLREAVTHAR
jgi:glycosyltransferase involved in cell wall biosynthesis